MTQKVWTLSELADAVNRSHSWIRHMNRVGRVPGAQQIGDYDTAPFIVSDDDAQVFIARWRDRRGYVHTGAFKQQAATT